MSEWTMMTGPSKWKIAYPLFMVGLLVIGIIIFFLIRKLEKNSKLSDKENQ